MASIDLTSALNRFWLPAWQALGTEPASGYLPSLLARYDEPHRHYHTRQHLAECFAHFSQVQAACEHWPEVALALWYHDAIYQRHGDNEAASAALAITQLQGVGVAFPACQRIEALIRVTRHAAPPSTNDQSLLIDIDLAILGASTERYAEYSRQVRAEYRWVPSFFYRRGRRRILESFLAQPSLYHHPPMRQALEASARRNLTAEITSLRRGALYRMGI